MISFRVESEALSAETKQLYPNSIKNYIGLLSTQEPDIQSAVGMAYKAGDFEKHHRLVHRWASAAILIVFVYKQSTLFLLHNLPVWERWGVTHIGDQMYDDILHTFNNISQ